MTITITIIATPAARLGVYRTLFAVINISGGQYLMIPTNGRVLWPSPSMMVVDRLGRMVENDIFVMMM